MGLKYINVRLRLILYRVCVCALQPFGIVQGQAAGVGQGLQGSAGPLLHRRGHREREPGPPGMSAGVWSEAEGEAIEGWGGRDDPLNSLISGLYFYTIALRFSLTISQGQTMAGKGERTHCAL